MFCIISWPVWKSGYITITQSLKDRRVIPAVHQHRQNQISMVQSLCSAFGGIETITGDHYPLQLMCLSRAMKKKTAAIRAVILQHYSAWPHVAKRVKTFRKTLKPQPPYLPDIASSLNTLVPIDGQWLGWVALSFLWRCQKIGRLVASLKRRVFFVSTMEFNCNQNDGKKVVAFDGHISDTSFLFILENKTLLFMKKTVRTK